MLNERHVNNINSLQDSRFRLREIVLFFFFFIVAKKFEVKLRTLKYLSFLFFIQFRYKRISVVRNSMPVHNTSAPLSLMSSQTILYPSFVSYTIVRNAY